jgi:hypothetical protein
MALPPAPPKLPQYLDQNGVTFTELEAAKIIVLDTFKDNLMRQKLMAQQFKGSANTGEIPIAIQQYDDVKTFFLLLYFEGRAYTLFTPINLNTLAKNIFTNDTIRDFVLNWTDMAMISLSVQDYSLDRLIETISQGICRNKLTSTDEESVSLSLVNEKVALAMQITPDYVRDTLKVNSWLLCITILYLFMSEIDIAEIF